MQSKSEPILRNMGVKRYEIYDKGNKWRDGDSTSDHDMAGIKKVSQRFKESHESTGQNELRT